jgi:arabinofuranosyltransferase
MTGSERRSPPVNSSQNRHRERYELSLPLVGLLIAAAVAGAAWLFLRAEHRIAGSWGYCLDDSWIYATFARNLATGHGFSFNPGEPVAGATGPLYAFILSIFYRTFHEVVWSAKIFGILCQIVAALAVHATVAHLLPGRRLLALLTAILTATAPPLVWGMLSGMEIPLYLLLVCAGLAFYVRSRYVAAIILWSIGVWARPDGLFLIALGVLAPPREMLRRVLAAAPILLAYFVFNVAVGGHWMPQTVGVKAHWTVDPARTWGMLRQWGELWGMPYQRNVFLDEPPLVLPFVLIGAAITIRRWPILALYALGFPLAFSLFQSSVMQEKRYLLYVVPFGMVLAAFGWSWLEAWAEGRWRHVGVAAAALCLLFQIAILPGRAERYAWNVQNIEKMQVILARFAGAVTKPGDAVAVNDIGAMGFFSGRYVVDLLGLITPQRTFPENLRRHRPRLLVIFPGWFRDYAVSDPASGDYRFFDPDSTSRYELVGGIYLKNNTICGARRMAVYLRLDRDSPSPSTRYLYTF